MRNLHCSLLSSFIIVSMMIFFSCNDNRMVVPNDYDSEDVFRPLEPNEENYPGEMTFGPDSLKGYTLNVEVPSDTAEVYIHIQQLICIDANPAITEQLLDFIGGQLYDFGFINDSIQDIESKYAQLIDEGKTQDEAVDDFIGKIKQAFNSNLSEIKDFGVPFNIVFDIYPVFMDKEYVTYLKSAYCYTGGAHGNTIKTLATFNLKNGEELTTNDIVKPEGLRQVREEVASHMAYSYPIYEDITTVNQYLDSLNVWTGGIQDEDTPDKITIDNFPLPTPALNETGLVFVYPMYELTPGSDGCPVIVIPYNELKGCLKVDITK